MPKYAKFINEDTIQSYNKILQNEKFGIIINPDSFLRDFPLITKELGFMPITDQTIENTENLNNEDNLIAPITFMISDNNENVVEEQYPIFSYKYEKRNGVIYRTQQEITNNEQTL